MVGPISVNITSDTTSCWSGLAVLTPHAVTGLGVGKTVGVDYGEDVEVVLVFVGGDCGVGRGEELICCILDDPRSLVSS